VVHYCSAVYTGSRRLASISPASFFEGSTSPCSIRFCGDFQSLPLVSLWLHLPYLLRLNHNRLKPEPLSRISRLDGAVDHFFDLSVGSDFPGTLIRDDSQAQLKLTVDELGFRYIRFHAIFHDVLGTVRMEDGKTVYNWSKIDQLYDNLLARPHQAVCRARFHTEGARHVAEQRLLLERQHVAPETGRLA